MNTLTGRRLAQETCADCGRQFLVGDEDDGQEDAGLCGRCLSKQEPRRTTLRAFVQAERCAAAGGVWFGVDMVA